MDKRATSILAVDASGGVLVGAVVLLWLDVFHAISAIPKPVLGFMGAANLTYGLYSSTLTALALQRRKVSRHWVSLLCAANLSWSVVCALLLVRLSGTIAPLGAAHLALEGLYVAALAIIEYRFVRPLARP